MGSGARAWWGPLWGGLLAWASSRLVLGALALVAQSMRAGLFPRYPRVDLLCQGSPCTPAVFVPWVIPSLGILVGAIGLWGLVEARSGREPAQWAVWLWLAAPMTLSLQFSASLAWGTGLIFAACWLAERRVIAGAVAAVTLAGALLPVMAFGAVAVAAILWQRGARRTWWIPLLCLALVGWREGSLVVGILGGPPALGPGPLESLAVMRFHALVTLLPLVAASAGLLATRDWGLGLAGLLLMLGGALLGVPWLGRLGVASPSWATFGEWAARSPLLRAASLGTFTLFQGMLLHFFIHRVPVL